MCDICSLSSPSGTTSRTKAKSVSLRSFTEIVDTVQDVAVVDMKPGLMKVDFAKVTKKKRSHQERMQERKDIATRQGEQSNCRLVFSLFECF